MAQQEHVSREQILFDRQVRLWGPHGQRKLRNTNLLALGSSVTITEALKGVILPSVESFTIVDDEPVTQYNVSNNFFLTANDLRKPIAKCLVASLGELNTSCRGIAVEDPISDYVVRLLVNTLYQLHHPSPQQQQQHQHHPQSMSDGENGLLTPKQYQQNLLDWITQSPDLDQALVDLYKAALPPSPTPIPGLPPHLQPKNNEPAVQTTSLFDFTMVLIDPTRIPLSLQTTLTIFTTAFNIPVLTLGSYSTLSLVKATYPQRCVVETHFNTHNGAVNLYLNRFQLKRFPQLVQWALDDEFAYLDMARPGDQTSVEYIDNKAKRSKVPYNLIIIRHAMEYVKQQGKTLEQLSGGDNENLKKFIIAKKWRDEDSYNEAFTYCRNITGNILQIRNMDTILNNDFITTKGMSFVIPNQEKEVEIPFSTLDPSTPLPDTTFFAFDQLLSQVQLFRKCVGITDTQNQYLNDKHALSGDYNHSFWLLVAALRLFILDFPLNRAIGNVEQTKQLITPFLALGLDLEHLIQHFTQLSTNLQTTVGSGTTTTNTATHHKAFGCFPINPSLPDMPASTELYGKIKAMYKTQFEMDCGLFLIYLNYVIGQYAAQRDALLGGSDDKAWYASLDNFVQHLKLTMHVDDPIHYFVLNSRQLRVNEATTSLGYFSTDYQDVFKHLKDDKMNKMGDNDQLGAPTTTTTPAASSSSDQGSNNSFSTTLTITPASFGHLLTPDFITKHRILSSFSHAYDSSTLHTLSQTNNSQKRIESVHNQIQNSFGEGLHNYLIDFYCSALSLFEFQYNSHRFPSTTTSISNTTIKLSQDVYSISKPLSKLLQLDSMQLPAPLPPSSTMIGDSSDSTQQLVQIINGVGPSQSDQEQLENHHRNIFRHLTHSSSFFDQNWDPIEELKPKVETTSHLFNHQFTELPTTASITGSIASDLMLKFALAQYSLIESTVLFDGLHSRGGVVFL